MIDLEADWYVVYTKPRQEAVAVDHLQRQDYLVYCPALPCEHRRSRVAEARFEPMFPRYCFFRPMDPQRSIAPVRNTVGVSRIVRFGSSLAVLSNRVVEEVRRLETLQKECGPLTTEQFATDQVIMMRQGPLSGIEGIVSEVGAQRIVVLLHLLGRQTRVSVAADWISAA
jgi:transcriptional antiterminator RfaH